MVAVSLLTRLLICCGVVQLFLIVINDDGDVIDIKSPTFLTSVVVVFTDPSFLPLVLDVGVVVLLLGR